MRRLLILVFWALLLTTITVGSAWVWQHPERFTYQWACWRVGTAESFLDARRHLIWFEAGPDSAAKMRELVAGWGTGNAKYDLYVARYAYHPRSGDELREALALELSWRSEQLPRWGHFWRWRCRQEPSAELASLLEYLDAAAGADRPPPLSWRDVLDAQAAFTLAGQPELAIRLKPHNLLDRYRQFAEASGPQLAEVTRPAEPFADWSTATIRR